MHNKVQKPLPKRVPPSLIFWIIAVICSGGSEATKGVWWDLIMRVAAKEGRKEGRTGRRRNTEERDRHGIGRTVALRFIQNGLNDGDNGGAQRAKRKPNPGRFVPSLPPMETLKAYRSKIARVKNYFHGYIGIHCMDRVVPPSIEHVAETEEPNP